MAPIRTLQKLLTSDWSAGNGSCGGLKVTIDAPKIRRRVGRRKRQQAPVSTEKGPAPEGRGAGLRR
jgi:hypothetical protein